MRALPAGAASRRSTIGDKNFTEEYILGDLYQQALEAKGYKVSLKPNIGSSEIIWKAATVRTDPDVSRVHGHLPDGNLQ